MSQTLTVQLSDRAFMEIQRQAQRKGISPEGLVTILLEGKTDRSLKIFSKIFSTEEEKEAARARFKGHFGELNLAEIDVTNESIDADLVAEYTNTHEEN